MDESSQHDSEENVVDEVLAQADLIESDSSQEEPPTKRRKLSKDKSQKSSSKSKEKEKKRKKSKKKSESSSSVEEQELTPEEKNEDAILRKQLKVILLKNPGLNVQDVMKITERVETMPLEEVKSFLEAAKMEMGLRKPLAVAENYVGLIALFIQRFVSGAPNLYRRLMNDSELIAAVDQFAPNFGDNVNSPLQILVRVFGHLSDVVYSQSHFSTIPPPE